VRHDEGKREPLAGPVRLTPDGLLKLEFKDDDDIITTYGVFTEFVLDRIFEEANTAELDDHDLESLLRSELAHRLRRLRAYPAYLQFRAAVLAGHGMASVVSESSYVVRRRYSSEIGGFYTELKPRDARPVKARSADAFREYWVQQYVAANYRDLGFDGCEGPFEHGPDFRLRRRKKWHVVEVETLASRYFKHGHHRDARWTDCTFLIVLKDDLSTEAARRAPQIICIERRAFDAWCAPAMSAYAESRKPETRSIAIEHQLHDIASVFRQLIVETCASRDSDMAMCPSCEQCAYFGEGDFGSAARHFMRVAAKFVEQTKGRLSFSEFIRFFDEHEVWAPTGIVLEHRPALELSAPYPDSA
jgi:hypothetical protein